MFVENVSTTPPAYDPKYRFFLEMVRIGKVNVPVYARIPGLKRQIIDNTNSRSLPDARPLYRNLTSPRGQTGPIKMQKMK